MGVGPGSGGGTGNSGSGGSGNATSGAGGNTVTDGGGVNAPDVGTMGGTGGSGGTPIIPETGASVLTRNGHITRDGYFTEPTLTKAAVKTMAMDMAFKATFTGNMMASPLYLEQGPNGKGVFIAVTTNKDIFALDETDGSIVWMKSYGPAPKTTGSPVPLAGFNGTPVIDATKDPSDGFATIYVAGGIGTMGTTQGSELHALSAKDGSERTGWPVSITKIQMTMAFPGFVPSQAAQRGSLQLVNGVVYVPYGGYYDPNGYRGWVVAVNIADPTKSGAFVTMGNGEGIWSAGGTASDGNGVIAVTGNTLGAIGAGAGAHPTDGESVLRITGLGVLTRTPANMFYPTGPTPANPIWQQMDKADNDFGSNSPVVLPVAGKNYVAALSKNGHLFLLDAANFGGTDMNGIPVGGAYVRVSNDGMQSHTALAAYTSSTGAHITFETKNEAGCPSGGGPSTVMSVAVTPGPPPTMKLVWCAPGSETSPISTTSDGKGADSIVWFVNAANALVGVDGDTGAPVATPAGACMGVRAWTSPIAVKGRIISGADGHLCAWKPM